MSHVNIVNLKQHKDLNMFFTPKTEAQKLKEAEEKRRRDADDDLIYSAGIFSILDSSSAVSDSCSSDSDFSSGFGCGD